MMRNYESSTNRHSVSTDSNKGLQLVIAVLDSIDSILNVCYE